jgi:ParB family transcriptional regulator, chromosome partitioning protein
VNKNDPRKALGKGLHSLLPSRNTSASAPAVAVEHPLEGSVQLLPIEQVKPNPDQPRRDFDQEALLELAQSIERDGIIQPLLARKMGPGEYQIIAGERRWRAAGIAGLKTVPVIVRTADDQQVLELAIIENIQREDLNPIELAVAFQRMATELSLSHEQIGQKTGKQRTTITNAVRLLQLPGDLQQLIAANKLSSGHARALLKFEDEQLQRQIAQRCVAEGWSVRQIEQFTKPAAPVDGIQPKKQNEPIPVDANVKAAIEEMERMLGTRVRIVAKGPKKGQIEIEYYSDDDLNRIYDVIVTK